PRPQRPARPVAPGRAAIPFRTQLPCEIVDADRVAAPAPLRVDAPHLRGTLDADGVVEPTTAKLLAEPAGIAVAAIAEDDPLRDAVGDRAVDHREPELRLRAKDRVVGDPRFLAARGVSGPGLGQVQFEVDRQMLG